MASDGMPGKHTRDWSGPACVFVCRSSWRFTGWQFPLSRLNLLKGMRKTRRTLTDKCAPVLQRIWSHLSQLYICWLIKLVVSSWEMFSVFCQSWYTVPAIWTSVVQHNTLSKHWCVLNIILLLIHLLFSKQFRCKKITAHESRHIVWLMIIGVMSVDNGRFVLLRGPFGHMDKLVGFWCFPLSEVVERCFLNNSAFVWLLVMTKTSVVLSLHKIFSKIWG